MRMNYNRKNYYRELRETIKHELIHAYCKENYEYCFCNLKNKGHDASPIFLTILTWVWGQSGHDCEKGFRYTEAFKESDFLIGSFDRLEDYIFEMLLKYNKATEKLKELGNTEEFKSGKDKDLITITNNFQFSSRKNGFNKLMEHNWQDVVKDKDGKYKKVHCITRTWEIGCNVTPERIEELYNKKVNSKATYYHNCKQLITINKGADMNNVTREDMKIITVRENKNF